MIEVGAIEVATGDKVRVHFHPPNPMESFCEGVVRRVNVPTPEGRVFIVDVTYEVILDREHRIRLGFQDYVRYACRNDFPSRIEILSAAAEEGQSEHVPVPLAPEPPGEVVQDIGEPLPFDSEAQSEPKVELETDPEQSQVDVDRQEARKREGLIGRLFRRQGK